MRKSSTAIVLFCSVFTVLSLVACGHKPTTETEAKATQSTTTETPRPVASIHDIMTTIVDPNADEIWDAVGTTETKDGEVVKVPKNDGEWEELRKKAVLLVEAANLLAVPGRNLVNPGQTTSGSEIKGVLGPAAIGFGVNKDFPTFINKAYVFQIAAIKELHAIEKKDPDELVTVGGQVERGCEGCHVAFWYPPKAKQDALNASVNASK